MAWSRFFAYADVTCDRHDQAGLVMLEYPESSCELDTWQERLGHERAAIPGVGRKFYCWQCTENLCIGVFYSTSTLRVCFYGFIVTPELVLRRGTCPRLACNSIGYDQLSVIYSM